MRSASSIRHPFEGNRIWRATDGSWFIVDEVVGKHEMITYAVALNPSGAVTGIEILEYVESYGYEVAEVNWRKQFVGKTAADPIKLNQDIQNIGGATLSCKHLTDGVKRVAVLYDIALKNQALSLKAK
jgi:Na+-translocating ferredoxin:NAD+ oxidoreductase RnfG subunit